MKLVSQSFAGVATSTNRVPELYYPPEQRVFDDPFALRLLPLGWRVLVRLLFLPGLRNVVLSSRDRRMPGVLGAFVCRTRYIDDLLKQELQAGIDQLVILGAGVDSRAYRIPGLDQVRVFEVDFPATGKLKQKRLRRVLGAVPEHVRLVGMDFEQQNLDDVLAAAGFQKGRRTLFIWEGVTQYLTAEAVSSTLEFVSAAGGPGSAIVFTCVRRGLIDGTDRPDWFGPFLSFAEQVGSPWRFGLDRAELEPFLAGRGLALVDDVGAADFEERYLQPLGRQMSIFDGERVVFARVKGS